MRVVELRRHAERDEAENLTAKGRGQCARARATLELPYDAYVSSPKKRALLTLEALGGGSPMIEERLGPRPRPPFEPFEHRHQQLVAQGLDAVTAWFAILEAHPALRDVGRVALSGVLNIAAKLPEEGRALAVSHGGTIEPFAVVALDLPYESVFGDRELANCEGVKAFVDNGVIRRVDIVRLP